MNILITNPALVFDLSLEEWFELLKRFYGLADSAEKWHQTPDDHVQGNMEVTAPTIDLSLYCKFKNDQIIGVNGS